MGAPLLDSGLQDAGLRYDVWGLEKVESTDSGSFYIEVDFGHPGEPLCNLPPEGICEDPHGELRKLEASRRQLDEFLQNGTGTNHCLADDPDGDTEDDDAIADGVCSFPSLSGCTDETEETVEAICSGE
jgi:hypothetical protein